MHIVIAGGSGFLGTALISGLGKAGHTLTVLTRDPARSAQSLGTGTKSVKWDGINSGPWEEEIEHADAVVNLAGESIGDRRWTPTHKQQLNDSRVHATRAIVHAIEIAERKPNVLVNASAVGYYGDVPEGEVDEHERPGGDFLAALCKRWEEEAMRAESDRVRVAVIRTGLVLAKHGGALAKLLPPFKMFVGGPLGNGRQWWPWIHIDDEIGIMMHAIEHENVVGPINATSPTPMRMKDFAKTLGSVLHRPAFMPAPAFALKILLGEMANGLLLSGQRAVPRKALATGYVFAYTAADVALQDLLQG